MYAEGDEHVVDGGGRRNEIGLYETGTRIGEKEEVGKHFDPKSFELYVPQKSCLEESNAEPGKNMNEEMVCNALNFSKPYQYKITNE